MYETNENENPKDLKKEEINIALCDVDLTLVSEKINRPLLRELKKADFKTMLFTNMSPSDIIESANVPGGNEEEKISRQKLIQEMKNEGLEVLGVITPIDAFYNQGLGKGYTDFIEPFYEKVENGMTAEEIKNDISYQITCAKYEYWQSVGAIYDEYILNPECLNNSDEYINKFNEEHLKKRLDNLAELLKNVETKIKELQGMSHSLENEQKVLELEENLGEIKKLQEWYKSLAQDAVDDILNKEGSKYEWFNTLRNSSLPARSDYESSDAEKRAMYAYYIDQKDKIPNVVVKGTALLDDKHEILNTAEEVNERMKGGSLKTMRVRFKEGALCDTAEDYANAFIGFREISNKLFEVASLSFDELMETVNECQQDAERLRAVQAAPSKKLEKAKQILNLAKVNENILTNVKKPKAISILNEGLAAIEKALEALFLIETAVESVLLKEKRFEKINEFTDLKLKLNSSKSELKQELRKINKSNETLDLEKIKKAVNAVNAVKEHLSNIKDLIKDNMKDYHNSNNTHKTKQDNENCSQKYKATLDSILDLTQLNTKESVNNKVKLKKQLEKMNQPWKRDIHILSEMEAFTSKEKDPKHIDAIFQLMKTNKSLLQQFQEKKGVFLDIDIDIDLKTELDKKFAEKVDVLSSIYDAVKKEAAYHQSRLKHHSENQNDPIKKQQVKFFNEVQKMLDENKKPQKNANHTNIDLLFAYDKIFKEVGEFAIDSEKTLKNENAPAFRAFMNVLSVVVFPVAIGRSIHSKVTTGRWDFMASPKEFLTKTLKEANFLPDEPSVSSTSQRP